MKLHSPYRCPSRTNVKLESVEADIAELEIDREDVHDRKKWRKNVMKMKFNHIEKRTKNK